MSPGNNFTKRAFDLCWEKGEVEAFRALRDEFKEIPRESLDEILRRLKSLKDLAFELGGGIHDNHFEREKATKRLKRNCPGFEDEIYNDAMSRGLFKSMW